MPPPRTARLVVVTPAGVLLGSLPPYRVATPWWQDAEAVVRGAREHLDADVTVLRMLAADRPAPPGGLVTYLAETAATPPGLQPWSGRLDEHPLRAPWARPGGPAADLGWADAALARHGMSRAGPARQMIAWNLSSVWRLPVPGGAVWMKHVPSFFHHEGRVLARMAGAPVPELVAHDGGRILMHEIPGEDLHGAEPPVLERLVDLLVGLQHAWTARVAELLALGLPDWRGPALTAAIAGVVDRTAGQLAPADRAVLAAFVEGLPERFRAIAEAGLPDTLVHGDFHPGNARGHGTSLVLLDWGDSSVGHPLLDQPAFLGRVPAPALSRIHEAWNQAWRRAIRGAEPERAAALLAPVAAARQAVVYRGFLDLIEPSEHPYHAADPADWLARTAALVRDSSGRRPVQPVRAPSRVKGVPLRTNVPNERQEAPMSQGKLTGDHESGAEAGNERNEGRPAGTPAATEADRGRPEPAREDSTPDAATTVAPEERGEEPETEHAPGSDL